MHRFREREESDPFESKSIYMDENNSPCTKKRRLSLLLSKNRERFSIYTADVEAASKKKFRRTLSTGLFGYSRTG